VRWDGFASQKTWLNWVIKTHVPLDEIFTTMKIKPMSIELAKEELALADLNATRDYLDGISFNIRGILHGTESELESEELRPVDIAENLIKALDIFTYTLDRLSHLERKDTDLPAVNSIVLSLRSVITHTKTTAAILKNQISQEYYALLLDRLGELEEVVDDTERVFFVLPKHKGFVEAMNELLDLE